ncbi:MAG: hypothetical protein OXT07_03840 [bacterium]|nr:hypothetical protein [bacterium]
MVSNYDRIFEEITAEANRVATESGLPVDPLIELVMEIVNTEDRHRIRQIDVNKDIENMITTTAMDLLRD